MKRILSLLSIGFVANFVHAQVSPSENYVYSKTYLSDPTLATPKVSETVQYLDGLGRPKQIINIKASPSGKDVVTPVLYDGFGRQTRDYLPVPQLTANNGAIYGQNPGMIDFPVGDPAAVYTGEKPFSEKKLESSPLDRILEQKQVGAAWTTKPVLFGYSANTATDVRKYITTTTPVENRTNSVLKVANDVNSLNGFYKANQLYKNSVKDEDGNETIEFRNAKGQTVLVRKVINATDNADTYYIYNEYNQLAFVISPNASFAIKGLGTGVQIADAILDNLCYQYRYDGKNRLVEKKIPGKGWEQMAYNRKDQIVVSRDTNLKNGIPGFIENNAWVFNKYDQFGRIIYTGISRDTRTRQEIQALLDAQVSSYEIRRGEVILSGGTAEYTNTVYPTDLSKLLTVTYYDTYPTNPPAALNTFTQDLLTDASDSVPSTKGLLTASYVKNIEDDNWTKNYTWYDRRGRPTATHSINHLGGFTKTESQLDFSGVPQKTVTKHKRLDADIEKTITQTFTYDSQNRLKMEKHKVDTNPEEILVQNDYNELSQLRNKKVGGTVIASPLQSIDYTYNIRGWMTKINDPLALGSDLFGYKINYNQVEGLETPDALDATLKVKPKFNGNIAEVSWKTLTGQNEPLRRYGYVYDSLNRLTAGFYQGTNPSAKEYFEKIQYDLNGNITRLQRSEGVASGNTTAGMIDNLKYDYSGNRLTKVTDEQQNPSGYPYITTPYEITYDDNGNMIRHRDKTIDLIGYNFLNLPSMITGAPGKKQKITSNLYRADGVKVSKVYYERSLDTRITDYLDGFQYSTGSTSVGGDSSLFLQFIPTSEGYFDYQKNKYIYNYTDHLGNVRLSYAKNTSGLEIIEENNYYPFGLKHEGYNGLAGNPAYQYKYNGKELQETGMYDYGARMYMADIGRWGVVDPLSETSRRWSTYNYAYNNPIRFIDPDGMQNTDVVITGDLKDKAFEQLQAKAGNLNLKMDDKGKVTGALKEGATITPAEQKLLDATSDSSVVVNLNATSENSVDNTVLLGGAFGGSEVDANGIVQTNQIMNPNQGEIIDKTVGRPKGSVVMHEILESYIAGKNNPGAPGFGIGGDLSEVPYTNAHNAANRLDPTHKNYSVSQTIDSVDVTIGGTRFGTVTTYINKSVTTPLIKSNGEPHRRKTITNIVKVPVSTAKDIRLLNR